MFLGKVFETKRLTSFNTCKVFISKGVFYKVLYLKDLISCAACCHGLLIMVLKYSEGDRVNRQLISLLFCVSYVSLGLDKDLPERLTMLGPAEAGPSKSGVSLKVQCLRKGTGHSHSSEVILQVRVVEELTFASARRSLW